MCFNLIKFEARVDTQTLKAVETIGPEVISKHIIIFQNINVNSCV